MTKRPRAFRDASSLVRSVSLTLLLMAVGGGCMYTINGNPDVNLLTVHISPITATVFARDTADLSSTLELTATIQDYAHSSGIIWTIMKPAGGDTIVGSGTSAHYRLPSLALLVNSTVTIRASSVEDPTRYAECSIAIHFPPAATFAAIPTAVTLLTDGAQQFGIDTLNGNSLPAIVWSIISGPGSISSSGLFTAPSAIDSDGIPPTIVQAASPTDTSTAVITLLKSTDSLRSFTRDVQPILLSCATSGCHDGSSRPLFNYQHTRSDVKPGNARASRLYQRITDINANTRMAPPPAPALTQTQVLMIGQWIDEGALQ